MKPMAKVLLASVLTMVVAVMLPALVLNIVGWKEIAGAGFLGAMCCFLAGSMGSVRTAFVLVLPLAVASGLAVAVAHNAWFAAVLMAIVAGGRGVSAALGLSGPLTMAPISVGFLLAQPPDPRAGNPAWLSVGLIVFACALFATLVVYLMR
ncbi:MAG: hypothetical protein WCI74_17370, partial [Actinomycetes bacterium]